MNTPDFHPLVARLETLAAKDPSRYRLMVGLLALLGLATLGGSLLLAVGLSAGLLILLISGKGWALLKLAIIPMALAWSLFKALLVRIDPPQGVWLKAGDAPELEREVERLRRATGAPALSGIVITDEFNASATSLPRLLGLFGHKHVLSLGLPMMQALSREQFLAVIAHEFGHFGGGHSKFFGWIYRVRMSWFQVRVNLDEHAGWLGAPLRKFFDWYAPYFGAYSFVLARQQEYEADAAAARAMGAPVAAQALVATSVASRRLQEDFWPAMWRGVKSQPTPPSKLYARMHENLSRPGAKDAPWLAEAMATSSDIDDTHPSLAQRLHALGCSAQPHDPATETADAMLGAFGEELKERLSEAWSAAVADDWKAAHERLHAQAARLQELAARPEPLDAAARSELACLRDELDEGEAIAQSLAGAVEHDRDNAELNYRLGRRLLDEGDASGIGAIEAAMHLDPVYDDAGLERLHRWHRSQGEEAAAEAIVARAQRLGATREQSHRQRQALSAQDEFQAHGLSTEQLEALRSAIAKFGKAAEAWIARKQLLREDGAPHYVVAVRWGALSFTGDDTLRKFVEILPLDGSWQAVEHKNLGKPAARYQAIAERVYPARG